MSARAGRPPILTLFVAACGLDVGVRLVALTLGRRLAPSSIWYEYGYRPAWELLTLFPTPGPLPAWGLSFFSKPADGPANVTALALGAVLAALLGAGLWQSTRWSRVAGLFLVPAAVVAALGRVGEYYTLPPAWMIRGGVTTAAQLLFAVAVVVVLARRDFGQPADPAPPVTGEPPLRAILILTAASGLLGLMDAAMMLILRGFSRDALDPLWWALPLLAAFACARLATARPDRLAIGLALGLCAFHVLLLARYVFILPFLPMYGLRALPIVAMLPLSGVGLVFGTAALRKLPDRGFAHAGAGGIGIFLALGTSWTAASLAGYQGIHGPVSPEQDRQIEQEGRSASRARDRVRAVARCAILYQSGHAADGYPVDLAALGPEGSRCLPADLLGDQDDDYAYAYEASGAGARDHFRVSAQARQSRLLAKVISVDDGVAIEDDSGFVATVSLMQNLWSCIEQLRFQEPSNIHPSSLTPVLALGGDHQARCVMFYGEQKISEWPAEAVITYQDYELVYTPRAGGSGASSGYTLAARPRDWGARYFRSYLMTEDGIIHGTPLPRAATAGDPEIRSCEGGDRGCFSGPGPLEYVDGGLPAQ